MMERNRARERVLKGERDIFKEIEREFKRERKGIFKGERESLKGRGRYFLKREIGTVRNKKRHCLKEKESEQN